MALVPLPSTLFFTSTKLPTRAPASKCAPSRRCANGPTIVPSAKRLALTQDAVHLGEFRARVTAQDLPSVCGHFGKHSPAPLVEQGNGVGQVEFFVEVIGPQLGQAGP